MYGPSSSQMKPMKPVGTKKQGPKTSKKDFRPHMMYKGKKSVMAKTHAEHIKLMKEGYTHTKPKK